MTRSMPPALLADAAWYGTLAAVRDLGARGVPVIVAYDEALAPARWSHYAQSAVRCPPTKDAERFLGWLHDFGARRPGCVLCLTSDDVAFMVASHRDSLAPLFRIFAPSLHALLEMLDKSRLAAAAAQAGLKAPATWSPADEEELGRLAREIALPVVVKPRTHVLSQASGNPVIIRRRHELADAWRTMRSASSHQATITGIPDVERPILQAYHAVSERIYTVDGFVDATGTILGATACVKCLQLPRRSGPGICFEPAALDPELLSGLQRLFREARFRGVFDAEFLIEGDDMLLIDLNPRFYNHMAFEVDRSLPLPWLSYVAALGDEPALRAAVGMFDPQRAVGGRTYVHRFQFAVLLAAQRASGRMTRVEARRWRRWAAHADGLTNPAYTPGDPLPACAEIAYWSRHPRSFLRNAATR